ncbi:hypothetical protein ACMT1E_10090 [Sphingomonas flavalba]|uniref:hypothetical protein n=1 Tax=Sphingomonas flavalba TaxID=2559804 RepID=UPI0039DFF384
MPDRPPRAIAFPGELAVVVPGLRQARYDWRARAARPGSRIGANVHLYRDVPSDSVVEVETAEAAIPPAALAAGAAA